MIEVEKKFLLTPEQKKALIADATFVSTKTFTDSYYDTDDLRLTTKDIWLRLRDSKFELKLPRHQGPDRLADQYEELESDKEIIARLELSGTGTLAELLAAAGYKVFGTVTTTRQKYQHDPFTIDLDTVDCGNFIYDISEIELMMASVDLMPEAITKIQVFAQSKGLASAPVRGKIIEYLKRNRPEHFQALVDNGVIRALG